MDERTYNYLSRFIDMLDPIFDKSVNKEVLINDIYYTLLNDYPNANNANIFLGNHSKNIIDILVKDKVKTKYSVDFSYAYINVYNRIIETYNATGQYTKTRDEIELLAFNIIFQALLNGYSLSDFNQLKMEGYIDQFANADIIRQNSIRRNEQIYIEEEKRRNCEKKAKLREDFVKGLVGAAALVGILIAGNIIFNTTKAVFDFFDKPNVDEDRPSYTEMQTIDKSSSLIYNYENNEITRSSP